MLIRSLVNFLIRPVTSNADNVPYSQTATVTDNVLRGYQKMIDYTISDLNDHLNILPPEVRLETRDVFEAANEITKERECSKQCLAICTQVSKDVANVQSKTIHDIFATEYADQVLICTPQDLSTATQTYQENLGKLRKIEVTNGDLTSAKQVVTELGGKQSIGQIVDVLTMRFALISSQGGGGIWRNIMVNLLSDLDHMS